MASPHAPVLTLEELDALDRSEVVAGYTNAQPGDPEPGANHSRAYHHGWRMRMMDLHVIDAPREHMCLVRAYADRERVKRGEPPKGPWGRDG